MTMAGYTSVDTTWTQWHTRCSVRLHGSGARPEPIARHWLGESPERLPGVPGTWWVVDGRVFIAAKPGDRLDHDGARIAGIAILDPADDAPGLLLRHDDHVLEVVRHEERTSVRVYGPAD